MAKKRKIGELGESPPDSPPASGRTLRTRTKRSYVEYNEDVLMTDAYINKGFVDDSDDASSYEPDAEADADVEVATSSNPKPKPKRTRKAMPPATSGTSARNSPVASDPDPYGDGEEDKKVTKYKDSWKYQNGISLDHPEYTNIEDIVADMAQKLINGPGFSDLVDKSKRQPITVATMCSGTESPLLVLELFQKELKKSGFDMCMDHVFSAEIEVFKQRYIQRNFRPKFIIRDITEFLILNTPGHTIKNTKFTTVYGSKKSILTHIDILIAGTVCVDFSNLNNKPKGLEQRGESGDTYFSLVTFMKYFRPSIVILENVKVAPWEELKYKRLDPHKHALDWYMHQIDYATKVFPVDTKAFYLPQTRLRCYMVCLDLKLDPDTDQVDLNCDIDQDEYNTAVQTMLDQCTEAFEKMKQKATAPVDAFLLDNDDPRIFRLKRSNDEENSRDPVRWDRCETGHHDYRTSLKLGIERALTRWIAGGASTLPDFWDRAVPYMTARVLDTLEISHLRNFMRGFDDRFISRFLELSQNVYRTTDVTQVGIMPCLTPNGIPFCTSRGRRVTGLESLILQGIPVNQLDLSFLSQRNLQDLAGNAMSTTVVGAVIMSTLVSCHSVIKSRSAEVAQEEVKCAFIRESDLIKSTSDSGSEGRTAEALQNLAEKTVRLCDCEGMHAIKMGMKKCKVCGHTACTECGQNPKHTYEPVDVDRLDPTPYMMDFFNLLPMTFKMDFGLDLRKFSDKIKHRCGSKIDQDIWDRTFERVLKATRHHLPIRTIKRRRSWEITYQNENAKVTLTISPSKVEWLWYLRASELPKGSPLRKILDEFPFARMIPVGNEDFSKGKWQFWVPYPQTAMMRVKSSGKSIPTYGSHLGVVSGTNKFHQNQISVEFDQPNAELAREQLAQLEDIVGTYNAYPDCGQAFNSMHAKGDFATGNPMFLYFYHNLQRGPPSTFFYVFTPDQRRVEEGEYLRPVAYLHPSWRQPEFTGINNKPSENVFKPKIENVLVSMDGYWVDGSILSPHVDKQKEMVYFQLPPTIRPVNCLSCDSTMAILTCESNAQGMMESNWPRGKWIIIDRSNEDDFVKDFRWLFQRGIKMTGHLAKDKWRRIFQFPASRCSSTCAPVSPSLQWKLMHKQTKKKKPAPSQNRPDVDQNMDDQVEDGQAEDSEAGDGEAEDSQDEDNQGKERQVEEEEILEAEKAAPVEAEASNIAVEKPVSKKGKQPAPKQYPFENAEEADVYEEALKARPPLLSIMLYVSRSGHVQIKIGANISTALHRAIAYLTDDGPGGQVEAFWRLVTDDDTSPLSEPFKFQVPSTKDEIMARQPPNWNMERKLRPEQLKSLQWQLRQENEPEYFIEQEIVEATIPFAGANAAGKATRPVMVKGGILAQEVGFGKTATSFGLIATQRPLDQRPIEIPGPEYFRSNATVIFVPSQLTTQWENESYSFMPNQIKARVIVIKSAQGLEGCSISKIKHAQIIIISMSVLDSVPYFKHLAEFSGLPEIDVKSSNKRCKSEWLKICLEKIRQSVRVLQNNPKDLFEHLESNFNSNVVKAANTFAFVPAKRTKGAAYVSKDAREEENDVNSYVIEKQTRDHSRFKVPATPSTKKVKVKGQVRYVTLTKTERENYPTQFMEDAKEVPFLHLFQFARLIIDEFSYCKGIEPDLLNAINAERRWALSGTPGLDTFENVASVAKFLKINLGRKDWSAQANAAARNEMTDAEKLESYQSPQSKAWYLQRNQHAQGFINHFVRRDVAEPGAISHRTHLRLVTLPAAELALYIELEQSQVASNFEMHKRKPQAIASELDRRLENALSDCTNPLEAFILLATSFNFATDTAIQPANAAELCSLIANVRLDDYNNLLDLFKRVLKNTEWLERNREASKPGEKDNADNFLNWKLRLRTNQTEYQDSDVIDEISDMVNAAEQNYAEDHWTEFYRKDDKGNKELPLKPSKEFVVQGQQKFGQSKIAAALRQKVGLLNRLSNELVSRRRKHRFMASVHDLQSTDSFVCANCNMEGLQRHELTLLGHCGHLICIENCLHVSSTRCPLLQCSAFNDAYQRLPGSLLGPGETSGTVSKYGQKLDDIVKLIGYIPKDEKVLIFVQSDKVRTSVKEALGKAKIQAYDLKSGKNAATTLTAFQDDEKLQMPEDPVEREKRMAKPVGQRRLVKKYFLRAKALILNIGDASSAGSNLTNANHVIFVSPYLTEGSNAQRVYEDHRTQAIGRARRYGQTKTVQIYEFITKSTIDVDIVEFRSGKIIRHNPDDEDSDGPYESDDEDAPCRRPYGGFVNSGAQLVDPEPNEASKFKSRIADQLRPQFRRG